MLKAGVCLDPAPAQPQVGVAVPDEQVGLHGLAHALGAQVVAHVGKTQARWNAGGAAGGGQQYRLGHAPAIAIFKHGACAHALLGQVDAVGVVAEPVAHRQVERHRALSRVAALCVLLRKCDDGRVRAIDRLRGCAGGWGGLVGHRQSVG